MMTKEEACERARNNFFAGFNCTQSVVEVFAKELGFDREQMLCVSQPFGAGICRMREVCGTVSGMMFCLGMVAGKSDGDKKAKDAIYAKGQILAEEFRKANGSIICGELLGLKKKENSPISEERTAEYYAKRPCPELCALAAGIVWEHLNDSSLRSSE